eukprot:scaffold275868_cov19-Prasinocladus_malaysianus.AAC.1
MTIITDCIAAGHFRMHAEMYGWRLVAPSTPAPCIYSGSQDVELLLKATIRQYVEYHTMTREHPPALAGSKKACGYILLKNTDLST